MRQLAPICYEEQSYNLRGQATMREFHDLIKAHFLLHVCLRIQRTILVILHRNAAICSSVFRTRAYAR